MPTIRVEIGPKHLKEAAAAADQRACSSGDPLIFADVVEKGLQLRAQASSVTWLLKWNGKTKSLGGLDGVPNAKVARELAQKVRALLRDGIDPKAFLTGKGAGKSDDIAEGAAKRQTALASGQWTWEKLVEEYADGYLSHPRLSNGRLKPPSEASARNAKLALMTPEADSLKGRLISELSAGDLEDVRDKCRDSGRKTASRSFVANVRAALSFARKKHARKSGLEGAPKWWLEVEVLDETAVAPRTRMPSIEDIARTLYVAEKHRVLDDRRNTRATSEIVLCGLWWLALTAQRTGAGFALEKAHVLPWPEGPQGWKVVLWSEGVMKSRRYHALPIPPRVALVFERAALTGREGSQFVFPATAIREGKTDGHLDKNAPKNLMERLRGKRANPKGGKASQATGVDLLEGVPHFSPHDIRRTFATVCGDLTVRGDATSAVLDHAGLETGQKMMRSADVTRLAYDYSQRLELKRIAMEAWCNAVFQACDTAWAAELRKPRSTGDSFRLQTEKLRRLNIDLSSGVPFSILEPWYTTMERRASVASNSRKLVLSGSTTHE